MATKGTYTALVLKTPNFLGIAGRAAAVLANRGRQDSQADEVNLEAEALGDVFGQLNHGSGCELPGYRGRSLSVGDVVIDPAGVAHMCDHGGWTRLLGNENWCEACMNLGYLHATNDGKHEIQRCDDCKRFESDEAALVQHTAVCNCGWEAMT